MNKISTNAELIKKSLKYQLVDGSDDDGNNNSIRSYKGSSSRHKSKDKDKVKGKDKDKDKKRKEIVIVVAVVVVERMKIRMIEVGIMIERRSIVLKVITFLLILFSIAMLVLFIFFGVGDDVMMMFKFQS